MLHLLNTSLRYEYHCDTDQLQRRQRQQSAVAFSIVDLFILHCILFKICKSLWIFRTLNIFITKATLSHQRYL